MANTQTEFPYKDIWGNTHYSKGIADETGCFFTNEELVSGGLAPSGDPGYPRADDKKPRRPAARANADTIPCSYGPQITQEQVKQGARKRKSKPPNFKETKTSDNTTATGGFPSWGSDSSSSCSSTTRTYRPSKYSANTTTSFRKKRTRRSKKGKRSRTVLFTKEVIEKLGCVALFDEKSEADVIRDFVLQGLARWQENNGELG